MNTLPSLGPTCGIIVGIMLFSVVENVANAKVLGGQTSGLDIFRLINSLMLTKCIHEQKKCSSANNT